MAEDSEMEVVKGRGLRETVSIVKMKERLQGMRREPSKMIEYLLEEVRDIYACVR